MPDVYDKEKTNYYKPGSHDDLGVHPKVAEEEATQLQHLYDSSPDEEAGQNDTRSDDATSLQDKENNPNLSELPKDNENKKLGKGFTGSGKTNLAGSNGLLKKGGKKWLIAGGAGILGGVVVIVVAILFFLSSLGLPNFMQNVTSYSFARFTRQFATSTAITLEEALAAKAADGRVKTTLKNRFGPIIDRFDKWRPEKVLENLGEKNGLKITYGGYNGTQVTHLAIGNQSYRLTEPASTFDLKSRLSLRAYIADSKIQAAILRAAKDEMKLGNINFIVRSSAMAQLRSAVGASLLGRVLSSFKGLTPTEAELKAAQASVDSVNKAKSTAKPPLTDAIAQGEEAAKNAEKTVVANPEELKDTLKKNGVPDRVIEDVKASGGVALGQGAAGQILSFANTAYAISVPLCIIFDGSMVQAQSTIDKQSAQQQVAYYDSAAISGQMMYGARSSDDPAALAVMGGAYTDMLGDYSNTNAMQRANGKPVDTSDSTRPQANAMQTYDYSILNLFGLPPDSAGSNFLNTVISESCPKLTSVPTAVVLGIANTALTVLSGGTKAFVEKAVEKGLTTFLKESISTSFSKMVNAAVAKALIKQVGKEGYKTIDVNSLSRMSRFLLGSKTIGKQQLTSASIVAGSFGLAELASLITHTRAGQLTSGLAMGEDRANNIESGGIVAGNEASRQINYGAPLSQVEIAISERADREYLASIERQKSFFSRYFDRGNAHSLVARMGVTLQSNMTNGLANSLLRISATILEPFRSLGAMLFGLNRTALAAENSDPNSHYGIVQFGWTEAEESLITSKPQEYGMAINAKILEDSGKLADIESIYGTCFTSSMGTLLSTGKIARNNDGTVKDDPEATCSPINLGVNNRKNNFGDLVFRYRLMKRYDNGWKHLEEMEKKPQARTQTAEASTGSSGSSGSSGSLPSGTSQELARQILTSPNISYSNLSWISSAQLRAGMQEIADTGEQSGCGGKPVSSRLLSTILALSQKYKITLGVFVNGHGCEDMSHSQGLGIDFNYVNGIPIGKPNFNQQVVRDFYLDAAKYLEAGGGGHLNQAHCFDGGNPAASTSIKEALAGDQCHHIHMDVRT